MDRTGDAPGTTLTGRAGDSHVPAGQELDVVPACAGDVPTQEVLAAADLLRRPLPGLAVRVVNIVDLARLMPHEEHPHGMTDAEYDALFTTGKPVIFVYHGCPWLIHRLAYRRTGHAHLRARGYKEMGTTTTGGFPAAPRLDPRTRHRHARDRRLGLGRVNRVVFTAHEEACQPLVTVQV